MRLRSVHAVAVDDLNVDASPRNLAKTALECLGFACYQCVQNWKGFPDVRCDYSDRGEREQP